MALRAIRRQMARRNMETFWADKERRADLRAEKAAHVEEQRTIPRMGKRAKHSGRSRYTLRHAISRKIEPEERKPILSKVRERALRFLASIGKPKEAKPGDQRASAQLPEPSTSGWKDQPKLYDKKGRPTPLLLESKLREAELAKPKKAK